MSQIYISDENPNEVTGGGGTLAQGETRNEDAEGPFAIFSPSETSSNISPHAVLSYSEFLELEKLFEEWQGKPEVIDIPDEDVVEDTDPIPEI